MRWGRRRSDDEPILEKVSGGEYIFRPKYPPSDFPVGIPGQTGDVGPTGPIGFTGFRSYTGVIPYKHSPPRRDMAAAIVTCEYCKTRYTRDKLKRLNCTQCGAPLGYSAAEYRRR
jgi:hypothetical protein